MRRFFTIFLKLARLVRIGWEGGLDFWLFLRCGGSSQSSSSSNRRLGKIRLQASTETIVQEWMRLLGTYVCRHFALKLFLLNPLNPSDARENAYFRPFRLFFVQLSLHWLTVQKKNAKQAYSPPPH